MMRSLKNLQILLKPQSRSDRELTGLSLWDLFQKRKITRKERSEEANRRNKIIEAEEKRRKEKLKLAEKYGAFYEYDHEINYFLDKRKTNAKNWKQISKMTKSQNSEKRNDSDEEWLPLIKLQVLFLFNKKTLTALSFINMKSYIQARCDTLYLRLLFEK